MAIIVRFNDEMAQTRAALSTKISSRSRGLSEALNQNQNSLVETRFEIADISRDEIEDLQGRDEFLVAEEMPIDVIRPMGDALPVTPQTTHSWGIKAVGADVSQFDGSSVPVAVLDTGIDKDHPAFAGMNIVERDFSNTGNGDTDGHGTHCAGTIFGRNVDGMRIGVAPGVSQAFIAKVIPGTSSAIVEGLKWAFDQGARVASMSLGIGFHNFVEMLVNQHGLNIKAATSMALNEYHNNVSVFEAQMKFFAAMEQAGQPGMVVVAATGNDSRRSNGSGDPYKIEASSPSASDGIVSVGAITQSSNGFEIADFSNTNPNVVGPGVDVISARAGGGLSSMSGTSMATPHVAGIGALYWNQAQLGMGGVPKAETIKARISAFTDQIGLSAIDGGNGLAKIAS